MKTLVIEDSLIRSMATNPTYVKNFPFLSPLAAVLSPKKPCTMCKGKRMARERQAVASMRTLLARQSPETLARLKRVLNVDQLQVMVTGQGGHVEMKTL